VQQAQLDLSDLLLQLLAQQALQEVLAQQARQALKV
jgi:hypothetical protein